ncbi:MAG TPA: hypothetical protein DDX98_08635 [Bacteroidales bacterium]|jgi:hypothetical protein|nr:hypothetical protein [Bacteroidales bacterium]
MKRKTNLWVLLASALLFAVSCDELADALNLDFDIGPYYVEFNLGPEDAGEFVESFDVIAHNIVQKIEDNGGSMDQLDMVKLKTVTLTIMNGEDNFDAFEYFEIYVKTPLMSEKKVGWLNTIPTGLTTLTPNLSTDNLKDYMQEGEITIVLKSQLNSNIVLTNVSADIEFTVNL